MKRVGIIHYGLGNIRSVSNAFEYVGASPFIATKPSDLKYADYVVLPGVGAFGDGMDHLNNNGWTQEILDYATVKKKPLIGLCLGMQLLASKGTEFGEHDGLGLIEGTVIKLTSADKSIRIPHIGWNNVNVALGKRMYEDIAAPLDYYFVHSFYLNTNDNSAVSGTCHHGQEFVASIEKDNVWGAQFHPEKSQRVGLALLSNFLKI